MRQDLTEVYLLLDMTGSMQPIQGETVVSVNNYIDDQKKEPNDMNFTLAVFNSEIGTSEIRKGEIKSVLGVGDEYKPNGMTPLYDAIGNSIVSLGEKLKNNPENERPGKVLFIIMTDGEENYSKHYNRKQIFDIITLQKDTYKWDFLFMGANQDSYQEAAKLNVASAKNFQATAMGVRSAYTDVSNITSSYRNTGNVNV